MANPHGEHIWYELLTTDADAAQAFYADVIGWSVAGSGMPGIDYRILTAPDGVAVGGLMQRTAEMPGAAVWLGYVGVDDVDAAVAKVEAAGGSVHMPAMTMDGVGRMAMVADPDGLPFYVMHGDSDEDSRAFLPAQEHDGPSTVGHAVWNELSAPDPDAALGFYGAQFGWTQAGGMPMGELGEYRFLAGPRSTHGALWGTPPDGRPGWTYYFHVEDIDAAVERARNGGGAVLHGPAEIPGGSYSAILTDPQGAQVGLVGRRGGA
ncbi:hypothetical protein GGR88_002079 [Sphingomonas jejuensis]|uniref:VOC domain-containing protein n=1 Tax=Sphingomonas jejuensis TaxID=904715 RepID=A0ABX0XPH4_9SPHN|nr:VOC family protein [Sphingomonas jejuensis]NJC34565.1 hypothetical protein [Sphingomonas jejuensis]